MLSVLNCECHVTIVWLSHDLHLQLTPVGAAMLADGAAMHLLDYLQFDCPENHGSFVTVEALGRLVPCVTLEQALDYQRSLHAIT